MSGYDYTTLVAAKTTEGSIKYWVGYENVPSTQILTAAELWLGQRLRVRGMRTATTVALAEGNYTMALPTRWCGHIELKWNGDDRPVDYVHENLLERFTDTDGDPDDGHPDRVAVFDSLYQFNYAADEALDGRLIYYARPAPLSGSATTNLFTTDYPALLELICRAYGYRAMQEHDTAATYFALAAAEVDGANGNADLERRGQRLA